MFYLDILMIVIGATLFISGPALTQVPRKAGAIILFCAILVSHFV